MPKLLDRLSVLLWRFLQNLEADDQSHHPPPSELGGRRVVAGWSSQRLLGLLLCGWVICRTLKFFNLSNDFGFDAFSLFGE